MTMRHSVRRWLAAPVLALVALGAGFAALTLRAQSPGTAAGPGDWARRVSAAKPAPSATRARTGAANQRRTECLMVMRAEILRGPLGLGPGSNDSQTAEHGVRCEGRSIKSGVTESSSARRKTRAVPFPPLRRLCGVGSGVRGRKAQENQE